MNRKKDSHKKLSRRDFLILAGKSALTTAILSAVPVEILSSGEKEKTIIKKGVVKMARLVIHDKSTPFAIAKEELKDKGKLYICACGLSKNKPYCDGSHKRCADEQPNEWYVYDDKNRVKIPTKY